MPSNAPNPGTDGVRTCLVTGGAGFIGSWLTGLLLDQGHRVVVIDNLSTGRAGNLTPHERLRFIEADLGEHTGSLGELGPFDEIYHLAAAVGVQLVMDQPAESIETNVALTGSLIRAASGSGPGGGPSRLLLASSSEVYGKGTRELFHEDDDTLYGPTTMTRWSYAASKALDEHLAIAANRAHGLPVVIARFFNTVGPRQVGRWGMVLPRFVRAALDGRPLEVHGDGEQSRCFCDVRDVVPVLPRLLSMPEADGRVFNVGSDQPVTIRELAEIVLEETGSDAGMRLVSHDEVYPQGFEDLRRRRPDLSRLREAVQFEPKIGLRQTVRDVIAEVRGELTAQGADA